MAKSPELINNSHLANAIYAWLTEHGQPASAAEIIQAVFPITNLPHELAGRLIEVVLEKDARFHMVSDGIWELALQKPDEMPLSDCEFICLDVEIIGHSRSPHIIEIAAVRVKGGRILDEYSTFINPGRQVIPKVIRQLYSENCMVIDSEMLEKAPPFAEIVPRFFHYIGDRFLVAHNAHFDLRMINRELSRLGNCKLVNKTVDTLRISRKFVRGVDTLKLPQLAYYFGVPLEEHHLALQDARALARIFIQLLEMMEESGIVSTDQLQPFFIDLSSP